MSDLTPLQPTQRNFRSPISPDRQKEKEELQHLQKRLTTYTEKVQSINEENKRLQKKLEEAARTSKNSYSKFEDEIKELRRKVEDLKKSEALLARDLRKKESEADEAIKKLEEVQKQLSYAEVRVISLDQTIAELRKELEFKEKLRQEEKREAQEKIQAQEQDLERSKASIKGDLQKEREKERAALKSQFDEERQKLLHAHSELIERLQEEISSLETSGTNLKVENVSYQKEVATLQNRIGALKEEESARRIQLEKLKEDSEAEKARLLDRLSGKDDEIARLRAEIAAKNKEVSEMTSENFSLASEIEALLRTMAREESSLGIATPDRKRIEPPSKTKASIPPSPSPLPPPSISPLYNSEQGPDSEKRSYSEVDAGEEKNLVTPSPRPAKVRKVEKASSSSPTLRTENVKTGIANIEELDYENRYIKIQNLTLEDIDLSGWRIQVSTGAKNRQSKPKKFEFASGSILFAEDTLKVLVQIEEEDGEGEGEGEGEGKFVVPSSMIKPGSSVQLLNGKEEVISQVDLVHWGSIDSPLGRMCLVM